MAIFKKAAVAMATASLLAAPVAAAAAPAAQAATVRADADVAATSDMRGGHGAGTILLVLVAAAMVYAIYQLVDDNTDPVSA